MKKAILGLFVFAFSSLSMANETIITCKGMNTGGALVKQLIVEKETSGLVVKAESYAGEGLNEVNILKSISTPTATKLILETNVGAKTSLVMSGKQAVMLYEAETIDDLDENGASIEFLTCK
ncbi:MAG: hypothetical protein H6625_08025 [Bdellovibrionaceae bacterium]|nr:hypothetical protein [Pseudobdellovibrionaceae bacterium]